MVCICENLVNSKMRLNLAPKNTCRVETLYNRPLKLIIRIKLIKYLKYLISLFLAFGLMVNDGALDSPSNSVDYYQFSNVILRREWSYKSSGLYLFNQVNSSKKTSFSIFVTYLKFQDVYSLQIRVLLKLRTLLYQKASSFIAQQIFVNEMITSRNSCESLYIA